MKNHNAIIPSLYRIDSVMHETEDTFTMAVSSQSDSPAQFLPGQFNMLYIFGVGEIPISVSGHPGNDRALEHTIRAVGVVTRAMANLSIGEAIGVRGPFGSHWPLEKAQQRDLLIVAGGLGLAPLRSAIYHVVSNRDSYRSLTVLYGTRSPEDIIYRNDIEDWKSNPAVTFRATVDHAKGEWDGNVGVVTSLIPKILIDAPNTVSFICGPEIMMKYTASELTSFGIEENNIYVSLERNMKCATGFCGHCQYGPEFVCKDGPVFSYSRVKRLLRIQEL